MTMAGDRQKTTYRESIKQAIREAQLGVTDQGPGVPPEVLPLLFDRFYRAGNSSGETGLGLGLYITRAACRSCVGLRRWRDEPPPVCGLP